MRISDWSSDVCSSDLSCKVPAAAGTLHEPWRRSIAASSSSRNMPTTDRSEEHTSELQSLMRISYAVFCLKKKNKRTSHRTHRLDRHTNTRKQHTYPTTRTTKQTNKPSTQPPLPNDYMR